MNRKAEKLQLPEELHFSQSYFTLARRAYRYEMYNAVILYCMLSLDAFVWRVLWGKENIEITGINGRKQKMSVIDFIYRYSRKRKEDFPSQSEFTEFIKRNRKLFEKLKRSDELMYKKAVEIKLITEDEMKIVDNIRIIRDVHSHFNPYEKTLSKYKEALRFFRLNEYNSKEAKVAETVINETKSLLNKWASRVST